MRSPSWCCSRTRDPFSSNTNMKKKREKRKRGKENFFEIVHNNDDEFFLRFISLTCECTATMVEPRTSYRREGKPTFKGNDK